MYNNGNFEPPTGNHTVHFVLGALLGAGVAMLLAPTTGKQLRGMISDKGRKVSSKVDEGLEMAGTFGRDPLASDNQRLREDRYV